jgi:hypothetical protein
MVDGAGNTKFLKLSTGAALTNPNNEYGNFIMARRLAKGWFPVDSCPVALSITGDISEMHLTEDIRFDDPCKRGTYTEAKPCHHTLSIIDSRQATQKAKMLKLESRGRTQVDRELESRADEAAALREAIVKLAEQRVQTDEYGRPKSRK